MDGEIGEVIQLIDTSKFLLAGLILIAALVSSRLITGTLDRLAEGMARRRLLLKNVSSIVRFLIFIGAALLILVNVLDLSSEAWLGLSATIGLTAGFAFKDTAASLISGILILMDRPFQVGDRIHFGNHYGEVREIGLRTVRIATLDDNLVSIPTNKFLTETVASANAGALDMMVVTDFFIAVDTDFEEAQRLAYEAAVTSRYVFLNKPVNVLLSDEITPLFHATRVRIQCYVVDCRFERKLVSDLTERVKRAFREAGIQAPYVLEHQVQRGASPCTGEPSTPHTPAQGDPLAAAQPG